jgi:hypothetical protein
VAKKFFHHTIKTPCAFFKNKKYIFRPPFLLGKIFGPVTDIQPIPQMRGVPPSIWKSMLFPILNPVLSTAAGRPWLLSITLFPRSFYSVVKGGLLLIIQDGKVPMIVIHVYSNVFVP